MRDAFLCPVCGEEVEVGALACPGCGACDRTGLQEEAYMHSNVDLPDETFDYDAFVHKEFAGKTVKSKKEVFVAVMVTLLILLYALGYLL